MTTASWPIFSKNTKLLGVAVLCLVSGCRKLAERPTALAEYSRPLAANQVWLTFNSDSRDDASTKANQASGELSVCLNGPLRIDTALKTIQTRDAGQINATVSNSEVCDITVQALRLDQRKNLIADELITLKRKGHKTASWTTHKGDYLEFSILERSHCTHKDAASDEDSEILQSGKQTNLQLGVCG